VGGGERTRPAQRQTPPDTLLENAGKITGVPSEGVSPYREPPVGRKKTGRCGTQGWQKVVAATTSNGKTSGQEKPQNHPPGDPRPKKCGITFGWEGSKKARMGMGGSAKDLGKKQTPLQMDKNKGVGHNTAGVGKFKNMRPNWGERGGGGTPPTLLKQSQRRRRPLLVQIGPNRTRQKS